jgi:hypothetical protein
MSVINEKNADDKKGVVCWFYVYKSDEKDKDKESICGIVIIKKLTDTNQQVFFYAETNMKQTALDGPAHSRENTYKNEKLIQDFIATEPTNKKIDDFKTANTDNCKIDDYTTLPVLLNDLIESGFKPLP